MSKVPVVAKMLPHDVNAVDALLGPRFVGLPIRDFMYGPSLSLITCVQVCARSGETQGRSQEAQLVYARGLVGTGRSYQIRQTSDVRLL